MAPLTNAPETKSVRTATDLSAKENYFVKLDTSNEGEVVLTEDAAAMPFPLVDGADGSVTEATCAIAVGGETKLKLGGSVNAGQPLTASTGGVAIATTTNKDMYGAIALENGASGDVINVLVRQGFVSAT